MSDGINMNDIRMEAEIIHEPLISTALRRALFYAGDAGFVASMAQLLHARTNVSYDNILWNTWFTAYTEESVITTPQGNHVVLGIHGGGIYASPERFEKMYHASTYRTSEHGFSGQFGGKITRQDAHDALEGKLSDGTEIPIFMFDEFKRGIANLPRRYGVVMDLAMVQKSKSGYERFDVPRGEPLMIFRASGVEPAAAYLDKYSARHNTKVMGNYHPYNRIDPNVLQTKILFLAGNLGGVGSEDDDFNDYGYDCDYGIGGDAEMVGVARFVAIAPRDVSTSLRYESFEM